MEHLAAMGWRTSDDSELFPKSKMCEVIENLQMTPGHVKMLSGNSMHLRTQMSFMLYAIAHVGRKKSSQGQEISRVSSWCDDFEDESAAMS